MRENKSETEANAIDIAKYSVASLTLIIPITKQMTPITKVAICIIASIVCFITIRF